MKQHKKQKLLKNYYNEPREEIEENIINYDNINDIGKKAIEFIKNDNEEDKIFIVKAACGTGKTHTIINEVLKHYQPNKHKILYLTENNILNTRFTYEHKNFISHTDKEKDLIDYNFISCSIQSIIRAYKKYDLITIDEIDSVLNSINDNITFNNSNSSRECFKMLS